MQPVPNTPFAPPYVPALGLRGEKPHQGVRNKNPAPYRGHNRCNFRTALGLRKGQCQNRVRSRCSGEQYDPDLGLYYLRARYYNPATGRFLSRDPENGNRLSPASLRKYLYAGGDPVNSFDPSGRASILETGSLDAVIGSVPVPALIALAGTAAENALLATGVSDAIAGIQLAAEAGSYEEVIDIVTYTAKSILQSRPLVRAFLCSPLVLAYAYGEDQLDDYAKDHHWNFLEIQAMDKALDVPKDALAVACGAYVLGLVK